MNPLAILLVGVVIVVGGVLVLRLHAFLALVLAALCVAALTPRAAVHRQELSGNAATIVDVDPDGETATLRGGNLTDLTGDAALAVLRSDDAEGELAPVPELRVRLADVQPAGDLYEARLVQPGAIAALQPGDLLVHPLRASAAASIANEAPIERVATGFGQTCAGIGILIAMAAIIGKCLLDSGAAERVVTATRNALGDQRTPLAFVFSGFVVGIPVFFDTVFYLLIPLGKAMRARTGRNYLLYVLSIVAGATMAHSLVPPTPGPLFVAGELGVDLGVMMLGGIIVGMCATMCGYAYALWANRRWEIPLRPSAELTAEQLAAMAQRDPATLPPLWLSLAPILLPVVLIAGSTVVEMLLETSWVDGDSPALLRTAEVLDVVGNKNIALILGAAVAMLTLMWQKQTSRTELAAGIGSALASGGVIILITAAGGAFGHVLRQTGIAAQLEGMLPSSQVFLLPLAFLLTALIRTAQGSATVAMITAVGIMAPIVAGGSLPFHPVYVALAIGCGSKPYNWMNDSGFWIISKMSGMTEGETLMTSSVMMAIMGVVGLAVTMFGAWLLPLA